MSGEKENRGVLYESWVKGEIKENKASERHTRRRRNVWRGTCASLPRDPSFAMKEHRQVNFTLLLSEQRLYVRHAFLCPLSLTLSTTAFLLHVRYCVRSWPHSWQVKRSVTVWNGLSRLEVTCTAKNTSTENRSTD